MLPVVALVGRPNVGKSTLFNRLTNSRDAVISALPGTTRDRQFGDVHYNDRHFIVIDTGGITDESFTAPSADVAQKDPETYISTLITQQALQAISDANIILFLIDGKAGITPEDKNIAATLRKQNKPIVLAVNKIDGIDSQSAINEAFELGLGQSIGIAGAHGHGVSQLIEKLFPEANPVYTPSAESIASGIKLAIVGRPNVGKSTLTNRMLGEERVIVHDYPGTTRDSIQIPLERLGHHYTLIDTAGVRRRKKINILPEKFSVVKTLQAIETSHVVLYVLDARQGVSDQDMKLLGFIIECGKALVIAVNKWDGMQTEERDNVRAEIDRQLEFADFAKIHFISALHGSGVGNLFDSVNEAYTAANKKLSTSQLTKLLQIALETHQPPLVQGRRIKLRYAHPGGQNPPIVVIHGNQVQDLPDSYRKFLAKFFQKKLALVGTPILVQFKASDNPYGHSDH